MSSQAFGAEEVLLYTAVVVKRFHTSGKTIQHGKKENLLIGCTAWLLARSTLGTAADKTRDIGHYVQLVTVLISNNKNHAASVTLILCGVALSLTPSIRAASFRVILSSNPPS